MTIQFFVRKTSLILPPEHTTNATHEEALGVPGNVVVVAPLAFQFHVGYLATVAKVWRNMVGPAALSNQVIDGREVALIRCVEVYNAIGV